MLWAGEAAVRSVAVIHPTAAGIRELDTLEFDSRTPQQPGNAIQETWQGLCHCVLHLLIEEKYKQIFKI